jgi:hypothetical protein
VENPVRALRQMPGSTSGGSEGGVMLVISGDSDTRGVSTSSFEISSEMAIKRFFSLHLWHGKYFSSKL